MSFEAKGRGAKLIIGLLVLFENYVIEEKILKEKESKRRGRPDKLEKNNYFTLSLSLSIGCLLMLSLQSFSERHEWKEDAKRGEEEGQLIFEFTAINHSVRLLH